MPYVMKKQKGGDIEVVNKFTGEVHSKHTTPAKATAQVRLLHAIENGYKSTGEKGAPMDKPKDAGSEEGEAVPDAEDAAEKKPKR